MFVAWPSIEAFSHVRKSAMRRGLTRMVYRGKVKLHGTNAGVYVDADGQQTAQSRSREISVADDNCGFAAFVASGGLVTQYRNAVVYGEWYGTGVQKGVAASQVPKSFAVFAVKLVLEDAWVVNPEALKQHITETDRVRVLPWHTEEMSVNLYDPTEFITAVNAQVDAVETEDPFILASHGVSGIGEGLVYYPRSEGGDDLLFKAKGAAHQSQKTERPAVPDIQSYSHISGFCDAFVTDARLQQAFDTVGVTSIRDTPAFLRWVSADIEKESAEERAASGLEWAKCNKVCTSKAMVWLKSRLA